MATARRKAAPPGPGPAPTAPPDQPPTKPAGAPARKDAPRTMRDLRLRHGVKRKAPRKPVRREPAARGPAPRARPGPGDLRPVRRHRRPRPSQGGPGALPAVADAPAAARVHAPRRRPTAVHDEAFRQELKAVAGAYSRVLPRGPRDLGGPRRRGSATTRVTSATRPLYDGSGGPAGRARRGARHPRQPALLPRHPAVAVRRDRRGQLGRVGLDHERHDGGWRRIVIEKPFGHDLDSAIRLNREVGKVFREPQVYRIDHYLGKETVRNLLVFRFGNGIFEPIWNRRYVDHVQITVAESIGIENRGAFYEETGASRDFLQNHLLQLLSLVAMEPPATFEADALRDEKVKVLRAIAELTRRAGDARRRPRPVRPRLGRREAGPRLPRGADGGPGVRDRDVRRGPAQDRRLALVRRPVLPADRQAPAQARDGDRDPVQGGPAPAVQGQRAATPRPTCWRSGSSPTRGSCCASGPRSRAWASTSAP